MLLQKKALRKKALQKISLDFCLENQSCDRRYIVIELLSLQQHQDKNGRQTIKLGGAGASGATVVA